MTKKGYIDEKVAMGCAFFGKREFDPDYYLARNKIRECVLELYESGINLKHIREWMVRDAGKLGELSTSFQDVKSVDDEIEFLKYLEVEIAGRLYYTRTLKEELEDTKEDRERRIDDELIGKATESSKGMIGRDLIEKEPWIADFIESVFDQRRKYRAKLSPYALASFLLDIGMSYLHYGGALEDRKAFCKFASERLDAQKLLNKREVRKRRFDRMEQIIQSCKGIHPKNAKNVLFFKLFFKLPAE